MREKKFFFRERKVCGMPGGRCQVDIEASWINIIEVRERGVVGSAMLTN